MAVREGQYLLAQQGQNKDFLLLRNGEQFHIVTVDKRLTEEAEERLLAIYPCHGAAIWELGINFRSVVPRGVAMAGPNAGDAVIFYIGKKKEKYVLSDDYAMEQVTAFFDGIQRFDPPKKKGKKDPDAWRLEEQKPELVPWMHRIKWVLTGVSVLSCVLLLQSPVWGVPGILVSLACVALDIWYAAYFTLLDWGKGREQKHAIGLGLAAALPLLVQTLYVSRAYDFIGMKIFLWPVAAAVVVGLVMKGFAREFEGRTGDLLALVLLVAIMASGPVGLVNGLVDRDPPQVQTVCIEKKYISNGAKRGDHYMLAFSLADGREAQLEVSAGDYAYFEVGDAIGVELRKGCLGIDYVSFPEE